MEHPSLNWTDYRQLVVLGVTQDFRYLGHVTWETQGVVWKASSAAIAPSGRTISEYTNACFHGAAIASLIRGYGILQMFPGDISRIVEASFHYASPWLVDVEGALSSPWPALGVMALLYDLRYHSSGLSLDLRVDIDLQEGSHSPAYVGIFLSTQGLPSVLLVQFVERHLGPPGMDIGAAPPVTAAFLRLVFRHYRSLGLGGSVRFVLTSSAAQSLCQRVFRNTNVCFPFISSSPLVSKYGAIASLLRAGVARVLLVTSDSVLLRPPSMESLSDIYLADEFYSQYPSVAVMGFANTPRAIAFVSLILNWAASHAFPDERAAVHYILHHGRALAPAPSFSYLPLPRDLPPVTTHWWDSESAVVTAEGWWWATEVPVPAAAAHVAIFSALCASRPMETSRCIGEVVRLYNGSAVAVLEAHRVPVSPKQARTWWSPPSVDILRPLAAVPPRAAISQRALALAASRGVAVPRTPTSTTELPTKPLRDYIVHINFADGCCALDQVQNRESALTHGANESRMLNGSHVPVAFRERNARLLKFDRTPFMAGKAPTSNKGYYVWKPLVILQSLLDESVPWGAVLVYSDAGITFTRSIRDSSLADALGVSDVSGRDAEMLEGHVSKRDAFRSLDADYPSIAESNQVASGVIALRKTPRSVAFAEWWLAACETPEVITEEPSRLGMADYVGFRHSNDDQTAFSLVFRKFGYTAFEFRDRAGFFEASRNLAKFVHIADAFALGGTGGNSSGHLEAADRRAAEAATCTA